MLPYLQCRLLLLLQQELQVIGNNGTGMKHLRPAQVKLKHQGTQGDALQQVTQSHSFPAFLGQA